MSHMRKNQNDQKRNKSLFCPGAENRPAPEELTELKSRLAEELEKLI